MKGKVAKTRSARLRGMLRRGCTVMPGAFNAVTARLIEQAGFKAVYVSGAGLANATAGVPDIGLLSREEVGHLAGYIAAAVDVPALVDADTGFGDAGRTTEEFERAGLAGLQIEDQIGAKRCGHLPRKKLVTGEAMTGRIRAACESRRDGDFVVVARTDAAGVEGFDAAVRRAGVYLDAGADVIFPEALQSEDEFAEFARQVRAPLLANMTEFGKSPLLGAKRLGEMGYRLVIFPQSALRVALRAEERFLRALRGKESQRSWLGKMQTRRELYRLLQYDPGVDHWPAGR